MKNTTELTQNLTGLDDSSRIVEDLVAMDILNEANVGFIPCSIIPAVISSTGTDILLSAPFTDSDTFGHNRSFSPHTNLRFWNKTLNLSSAYIVTGSEPSVRNLYFSPNGIDDHETYVREVAKNWDFRKVFMTTYEAHPRFFEGDELCCSLTGAVLVLMAWRYDANRWDLSTAEILQCARVEMTSKVGLLPNDIVKKIRS